MARQSGSLGRGKQQLQGFRSIPRIRTLPAIPEGPRMYKTPRDKGFISEFKNPPPGFATGQNSPLEWMVYLAFWKILGLSGDARTGPFEGFPGILGYQVGGSALGQSKIDFVVYPNRRSRGLRYAFRIQTEYFHNFTDNEKQVYDIMQSWHLSEYNVVVDIYDYEFAEDPTGQAVCILLKRALNGELWSPPGATGYAMRVRPGRRMG
jgi:hypothetical protein